MHLLSLGVSPDGGCKSMMRIYYLALYRETFTTHVVAVWTYNKFSISFWRSEGFDMKQVRASLLVLIKKYLSASGGLRNSDWKAQSCVVWSTKMSQNSRIYLLSCRSKRERIVIVFFAIKQVRVLILHKQIVVKYWNGSSGKGFGIREKLFGLIDTC